MGEKAQSLWVAGIDGCGSLKNIADARNLARGLRLAKQFRKTLAKPQTLEKFLALATVEDAVGQIRTGS